MNTQLHAIPDSAVASHVGAPAMVSPLRRMYWLIRCEFWEYRFLYVAPLALAALAFVAFCLSATAGIWEPALRLNPADPQGPFDMAAGLLMLTGILVTVFYCLDALHGERRDRSILFWKSLPVSDLATVLAKASIPLLVLPLLIFAITVAMQWMMLLVSSAVVLAAGQSVAMLWAKLSFGRMSLLLLYHLLTNHALWPAPVYCWLLLVSGWSRRAPFLWATLPLVAIAGVERLAFHTWHFANLVASRFFGDAPTVAASTNAFPMDPGTHIMPGTFFSSPGLWVGLFMAAIFLAAAVHLRRSRGPI